MQRIQLRYFFVKDVVESGKMEILHAPTDEMEADFKSAQHSMQKQETSMMNPVLTNPVLFVLGKENLYLN